MAIPSGSGTEVLKRATIHASSDAWTAIITGVQHHIYTILNVICSEQNGTNESIFMRIDVTAAGANQIGILQDQSLPKETTFVWNDRFVMVGTDKLEIYNTPGNCDWHVSYIDQDWT